MYFRFSSGEAGVIHSIRFIRGPMLSGCCPDVVRGRAGLLVCSFRIGSTGCRQTERRLRAVSPIQNPTRDLKLKRLAGARDKTLNETVKTMEKNTKLVFLFPGQGSHYVGMGKALHDHCAAARHVFEEVDEALGESLSRICFEGSLETLTRTRNVQPALMAVSMAVVRVLEHESDLAPPAMARLGAGHSLGEYSALCAFGALSLRDTARLLRLRGEAMQRAVPPGQGAMAALLGLSLDETAELLARFKTTAETENQTTDIVEIANDNAPGQVVVSGHTQSVKAFQSFALSEGVKRVVLLPVSAPFHCTLMAPAEREVEAALAQIDFRAPSRPILSNYTAAPTSEPSVLRQNLVAQVCGRVRWRESIEQLGSMGIQTCAELGAGTVLTNMGKRVDKSLRGVALSDPESVFSFLETFFSRSSSEI